MDEIESNCGETGHPRGERVAHCSEQGVHHPGAVVLGDFAGQSV